MAREHSYFKKGNRGGPGRPKLPDEFREVSLMTADSVRHMFSRYCQQTPDALRALVKDGSLPAIDLIFCKILSEAFRSGDERKLAFILDRTIGKPPTLPPPLEIDGTPREAPVVVHITTEELVRIARAKPEPEAESKNTVTVEV